MKFFVSLLLLASISQILYAEEVTMPTKAITSTPRFSTAGFFKTEGSPRVVYSLNPGWRFFKGNTSGAEYATFNDSNWKRVSLPHGIENQPLEASGCTNYQGIVWYRKHLSLDDSLRGKKLFINLEAIMGKCTIWINGEKVKTHFGGFTPIIIDATKHLTFNKENIIAIKADNSDDGSYPPGKPQNVLDFTYSGGIYRDAWLVSTDNVYITDPNFEDKIAGGGLFFATESISDNQARAALKLHLRNDSGKPFSGKAIFSLKNKEGKVIASATSPVKISAGSDTEIKNAITVKQPELWTPENPNLYTLSVTVKGSNGATIDGYEQLVGLRTIEFRGMKGLFINGKLYPRPLIGANRHQDFAVVGSALSNSLHWRDAYKLKAAGIELIRNAHYPQDPAFMDACDQLGLFVIENTPGWQYWNPAPSFEQGVYSDIKNIVRRDRNRPSVLLWEPILNETHYPKYFAANVDSITRKEFPYPGIYTSCDMVAQGSDIFPVIFTHPVGGNDAEGVKLSPEKSYYTREWGDNVDDWNSHNSPSRVSTAWGERPQLVQAIHYLSTSYAYTNFDLLYKKYPAHIGGALWHSFDHQRGYHPDPFYGGIMDNFRQPKYSYYMFQSQQHLGENNKNAMIFIANELTPFSDSDVQVYTNCDSVVLHTFVGDSIRTFARKPRTANDYPSPIITFENAYDFMAGKALSREGRGNSVVMRAEGFINGVKVVETTRRPARRPSQIRLWLDNDGLTPVASGGDLVTVVAAITDAAGNIKRLNNCIVKYEIEGEGSIVGDSRTRTSPRHVQWGTAPVLVRTTTTPGKIRIKALVLIDGEQMPVSGTIEFQTESESTPMIYTPSELPQKGDNDNIIGTSTVLDKSKAAEKLREVETQQQHFE